MPRFSQTVIHFYTRTATGVLEQLSRYMRSYAYVLSAFLLAIVLGYRFYSYLDAADSLASGATLRVRGAITSQPYLKDSKQIMRVGEILVQTEAFPRYKYGDQVQVIGKLRKGLTDSRKSQIWLIYPDVQLIDADQISSVSSVSGALIRLGKLRQNLVQLFEKLLPEPQASLLSGVLLGAKRSVPGDFAEALRRTGTLHVVVASGYNVTVVAGILAAILLRFVSRPWTVPFIILGIGVYTLLAGADPPIVRAAIMGGLAFTAQLVGKHYQGLWALLITFLLMLIVSPASIFDIGFQLSFAATGGILLLTPLIFRPTRSLFGFISRFMVEGLSVTLGAQLAVAPLLLVHFKEVSWLSPLVNLLVVGLVPMIMGLGAVLVGVGFFWEGLAQVLALFVWVPLTAFVAIVNWFNRLPVGTIKVESMSWVWVIGFYSVLGWWVWRNTRAQRLRQIDNDTR